MTTALYPSDRLRKKLAVAGILEGEHDVESLAKNMPDIQRSLLNGMTADGVAETLLYFIAKGIVSIPLASNRALLDMPWGSHVCQFYDEKEDLVEMLVPYFQQGLERNEACAWMVGDLTVEEAKTALQKVVPDLDKYLASGQMVIKHYTELYTNPDGSVKPSAQLSEEFAAMGPAVAAAGYNGLRASGSVAWVKDQAGMTDFMAYETKVNLAIQNSKIMAVCTYPAQSAALCQCRELIHNHGKIFVKRGEWVHDKSKDAEKIESVFAALARPAADSRCSISQA